MRRPRCWIVEGGSFRPCEAASEFSSIVCLHTHSSYSTEDLASLNWVAQLGYMRPFRGVLQASFGLDRHGDVDYRELRYHPPFRPADIWRMERDSAARLGLDRLLLAITDHDEVSGALELCRTTLPEQAERIAVGEELSIRFQGRLFHLGLSGLPRQGAEQAHAERQACARRGDLDGVFEQLQALGCLVVLNHPLIVWHADGGRALPTLELLKRYGWAIGALELNGMRSQAENRAVVELARHAGKPLIGGGDSHLLRPSAALTVSRAATYAEFVDEVRAGLVRPLVTREYFFPLRWKLTLRVLSFVAQYRNIAEYRGEPVRDMLVGRRVALDPVGQAAAWLLTMGARLGVLA